MRRVTPSFRRLFIVVGAVTVLLWHGGVALATNPTVDGAGACEEGVAVVYLTVGNPEPWPLVVTRANVGDIPVVVPGEVPPGGQTTVRVPVPTPGLWTVSATVAYPTGPAGTWDDSADVEIGPDCAPPTTITTTTTTTTVPPTTVPPTTVPPTTVPPTPPTTAAPRPPTLPHTGLELWHLALAGAGTLAAGLALRRAT